MTKQKTTRDRQCKKISKQRAHRQRLRVVARRVGVVFSVLCVVMAGAVGWSVWSSGKLAQWQQQAVDGMWQLTADAGFSLENVYVSGHQKVDSRVILAAVNAQNGQSILALSLPEIKEKLEKIPLVRQVNVSRSLPHNLHIAVEERQAAAVWQYQGRLQLVDAEGVPLGKADLTSPEVKPLPLLVGQMEAEHIREFFAFLNKTSALRKDIKSASLISQRRWDITLKQGIQIKLPESDLDVAWQRLSELVDQKVLTRDDVQVIDLRVPDRLFIREQKPLASEEGAQNT